MAKVESQIISVRDTEKSLRVTPDRILIPDQILSREVHEALEEMDGTLTGCEGEECWWDELRKSNWPPRRFEGLIQIEENRAQKIAEARRYLPRNSAKGVSPEPAV